MRRDYDYQMDAVNFEDMKMYNFSFTEESVKGMCDADIRAMFKEFYAENLPVDLLTWMRVYEPKNEMHYKKGYYHQTVFVRDEINGLLRSNYEEYKANPVKVISTHVSKSITLPVYCIYLRDYDTKIIMRNNFYNWMISVDSKFEIEEIEDFVTIEKEPINPLYCEGFKDEWVYGMYKDSKRKFTIGIPDSQYVLYTFFYMLKKSLTKRHK